MFHPQGCVVAVIAVVASAPALGQCREARLGWEPYPDATTLFFRDVAIDGDTIAVARSTPSEAAVTVHEWQGDAWVHTQTLTNPDPAEPKLTGALELTAGWLAVADTNNESDPVSQLGGVYAFEDAWLCPGATVGATTCVAGSPNSTGLGASLEGHGSAVVSDDLLGLWSSQLPAHQFCVLLAGMTPGQTPLGSGTLCLGGTTGRILDQLQASDILGQARFRVRLDMDPTNPAQPILSGQTWIFQCAYRDLDPGPTFNFSDAVAVMMQ
ncbi:MAG: hypothetical protein GY711_27955 [bacterium]|nr:hypothetical protein [bacterium]